jgi:hypothetical protein
MKIRDERRLLRKMRPISFAGQTGEMEMNRDTEESAKEEFED